MDVDVSVFADFVVIIFTVDPVIEHRLDDPFPDYDHKPVFAENWQSEERKATHWGLRRLRNVSVNEPVASGIENYVILVGRLIKL